MSYALNNTTTADGYTPANTLGAGATRRVNLDVSNAAIYYQLGIGTPGTTWQAEVFMAPSFRSLDRACDAIRVRSAKAGTPAQVTVDALTAGDLNG